LLARDRTTPLSTDFCGFLMPFSKHYCELFAVNAVKIVAVKIVLFLKHL